MRRDRAAPIVRFARGSTTDPGLTRRAARRDDDRLVRTVSADRARRDPRPPLDGRPAPPVAVVLRMLVVQPLAGGRDDPTAPWVSEHRVPRQCCRIDTESGSPAKG